MEIRQLITFRRVAELQSFSKAAESMGYSQSAVTVQIKALEKEFNVRFFDRYGKTVRITPAGIQFQRRIDRILNELDSLHSDLGEGKLQTHKLHIGTLSSLCSFMLPEMMKRYYREFPDYHVKITRGSPTELIDMMEHNELDIIYILDALRFDTHWRRVVQKKEPVVFVCAPECRLADRGEVEMEEILEEPLMLTEVNDNYRFALE
ncbi:regulatory helix-turn-helix protein, lysR family, partial [[Clostridium] aminophilum]